MCMIVKDRLALVVEERKLVAEEQGSFRKGRGCRDQIFDVSEISADGNEKKWDDGGFY